MNITFKITLQRISIHPRKLFRRILLKNGVAIIFPAHKIQKNSYRTNRPPINATIPSAQKRKLRTLGNDPTAAQTTAVIPAVITHPRLVKFTSDRGGTLAKRRSHPSALSSPPCNRVNRSELLPRGEGKVSRIISAIHISFIGRQM